MMVSLKSWRGKLIVLLAAGPTLAAGCDFWTSPPPEPISIVIEGGTPPALLVNGETVALNLEQLTAVLGSAYEDLDKARGRARIPANLSWYPDAALDIRDGDKVSYEALATTLTACAKARGLSVELGHLRIRLSSLTVDFPLHTDRSKLVQVSLDHGAEGLSILLNKEKITAPPQEGPGTSESEGATAQPSAIDELVKSLNALHDRGLPRDHPVLISPRPGISAGEVLRVMGRIAACGFKNVHLDLEGVPGAKGTLPQSIAVSPEKEPPNPAPRKG